jgi:hypothetical protein
MPPTTFDFLGTLASNGIALVVLGWMVKYFIGQLATKDEIIKQLMVEFKADIKAMTTEARDERTKIVDKFTNAIDRLNTSVQEVLHGRDGKDGLDGRRGQAGMDGRDGKDLR